MKKILLIEDDETDVKILRRFIVQSEFTTSRNILWVKTLEEGMFEISEKNYDVVICDLGLADGSGADIISRLQKVAYKVPIVVATGDSRRQSCIDAFFYGAEDYLTKADLSAQSLYRCLTNAIERKKLRNGLAEATSRAKVASAAKTSFLAKMSHEIRTPLHLLMGTADLLKGTDLSSQQEKYVNTFEKASNHLLSIINNVLDMSKIESGDLQVSEENFNLENELNKVAELASLNCGTKKIGFEYYFDPKIPKVLRGDSSRVKQILLNLINNSIKYTDNGQVTLKAEIENGLIVFTVQDTGIGIPAKHADAVFDSFYQIDRKESKAGTGLGLTIAKELAHRMGGDLILDTSVRKGTCFKCYLPYLESSTVLNQGHALRGKKIFASIQGEMNQQMVEDFVELHGGQLMTVDSGEEAYNYLMNRREKFDYYLLDVQMYDFGALTLIERLQGQVDLKKVIFLLPMIHRKDDLHYIESYQGARFVYKPIGPTKLEALFNTDAVSVPNTTQKHESPVRESYRILVAEDDIDNQELLKAYLAPEGHKLTIVPNGQEAVDTFDPEQFDIVFLDIQMPLLNGIQVAKRIRKMEKSLETVDAKIPIYGLSANAFTDDVEEAMRAGFTGYMTKPLRKSDLVQLINSVDSNPNRRLKAS